MKFKLGFLKRSENEDFLKTILKSPRKSPPDKKSSWMQRVAKMFVRLFTLKSKSSKSSKNSYGSIKFNKKSTPTSNKHSSNELDMKDEYEQVLGKGYKLKKVIGQGTFGKVYKAMHKFTGEAVAIKIVNKEQLGIDLPRAYREIEALKSFDHPNISQLYEVLETERTLFIIMEFCESGDLFELINSNLNKKKILKESEVKRIFRQLVSAVRYVHSKDIAHRDLKPENVLLDANGNVKLIDFNLCAKMTRMLLKRPGGSMYRFLDTHCGTMEYVAPELLNAELYDGILSDSWSLGVMLYTLLCGSFPFEEPGIKEKILSGTYEEPKHLSKGSKLMLRRLLQVAPSMRPTSAQILYDPWLMPPGLSSVLRTPKIKPDEKPKPKPLDEEILMLMSSRMSVPFDDLKTKIAKHDFDTDEVATYLILTKKKEALGSSQFFIWKCEWEELIQKLDSKCESLDSYGLENIQVLRDEVQVGGSKPI